MARLEVEDAALLDLPRQALPRLFRSAVRTRIEAVKDQGFRRWRFEWLSIALRMRNNEIPDASCDRVPGRFNDHVQLRAIFDISTLPAARRAHQGLERLRPVGRV